MAMHVILKSIFNTFVFSLGTYGLCVANFSYSFIFNESVFSAFKFVLCS